MKKLLFIIVLSTMLFSSCKEKWEYSVITVNGTEEADIYLRDNYNPKNINANHQLNAYGEQGWELVSAYPIIETVYPNFGDEQYHTGIKTNTRTRSVQYIFKRKK